MIADAANAGQENPAKQLADWCHNCGLCCMHMRTPPFAGQSDPRWKRLPARLKNEIEAWVMSDPSPRYSLMVLHDGAVNPCIWLDLVTGSCRHYELRPDVCRDYEVGNESCREVRLLVGLTVKGMPVAVAVTGTGSLGGMKSCPD